MTEDQEKRMRDLGMRIRAAEDEMERMLAERQVLVGEMVDAGYSTYKIGELAGIAQPRIVQINNIAKGGTQYRSAAPRGKSNQPRNKPSEKEQS